MRRLPDRALAPQDHVAGVGRGIEDVVAGTADQFHGLDRRQLVGADPGEFSVDEHQVAVQGFPGHVTGATAPDEFVVAESPDQCVQVAAVALEAVIATAAFEPVVAAPPRRAGRRRLRQPGCRRLPGR